jgi:hypothetical protein
MVLLAKSSSYGQSPLQLHHEIAGKKHSMSNITDEKKLIIRHLAPEPAMGILPYLCVL